MAAPTFVASYESDWTTASGVGVFTKTVSVTTQPGDIVVVFGAGESSAINLVSVSGNSIGFTLKEFSDGVATLCPTYLWTGTDASGGTNWTLTATASSDIFIWGFGCAVFRSSNGIGNTGKKENPTETATLDLITSQDNSAILVVNTDWNAATTAQTWATVNSITPTNGNGLELFYNPQGGTYTDGVAYYNDAGTAGTKTVGLTAPGAQNHVTLGVEILGNAGTSNTAYVSWLRA